MKLSFLLALFKESFQKKYLIVIFERMSINCYKMFKNKISFLLLVLLSFQMIEAQKPQKLNSVEIYNQIQKLNFLGSVLYIAAHPDDENTGLISYLSNEKKARTAYLSLTRGDGGQNLIGSQLGELLGVIRTQELIEARKIDGGEQLFTRANDFGFSKNPEETLAIWDKEKILSDVVWAIRKFRPDIIINRFDHRTSGNTHGHHSASAILSTEGFHIAKDSAAFPDQLDYIKTWQPKRQFFNPSWWFYGSKEKLDAADKSNFSQLQIGVYYANLGKSNQEISALSRSSHKSQGFGSTGSRGQETEYLELINGAKLKDPSNIFEGIDTTWNRVKGGKPIGELLSVILSQYDYSNPSASIPNLTKVYAMIQNLEEHHWKTIKTEELKKIITACSGLYLEAASQNQEATPGSTINIRLEAINRSSIPMELVSINSFPDQKSILKNSILNNNRAEKFTIDVALPTAMEYTQPFWLKEKGNEGMYTVTEQKNIGIPDIIREVKVIFNININGVEIPFERTVVYKYNDNVNGEMYNYLDIVPEVTTHILDNVTLFSDKTTKSIGVKIVAGKDNLNGQLQLELPDNWIVSPKSIPFTLDKKGAEQIVYFDVSPPHQSDEVIVKSVAIIENKKFDRDQKILDYSHIAKQQTLLAAEAKLLRLDLKMTDERIGYIMGAGDNVPESLRQMGYKVNLVHPNEISEKKLAPFDVIIMGVRAFNTIELLATKKDVLFDFIKEGKTLIVQYNTPNGLKTPTIAPFPMKLSNDRVTDENAAVQFLAPDHPVLNYPNKITEKDFKGWKQEQGIYYPNEFDPAFTPILSSNDKGESAKNGALLIAPYGKGYYIYTGLSLFRELPEGVPGAFRLLSNMISLGVTDNEQNTKP